MCGYSHSYSMPLWFSILCLKIRKVFLNRDFALKSLLFREKRYLWHRRLLLSIRNQNTVIAQLRLSSHNCLNIETWRHRQDLKCTLCTSDDIETILPILQQYWKYPLSITIVGSDQVCIIVFSNQTRLVKQFFIKSS